MSKVRRIDFNPDEFLTGVFGKMNAAQCGIYWTICAYIYSEGGPVRQDDTVDTIARCLKTRRPDVLKAIDFLCSMAKPKLLREQREDGVWLSQERAQKELRAASKRIETNTKNARGGGKDEEIQGDDAATPISVAEPPASLTTNHQPPTIKVSRVEGSAIPLDRQCLEDFDAILVEVFGPEQARAYPNSLDLIVARRWIEQGVQPSTWTAVFRAKQMQRRAAGLVPINTLSWFDAGPAKSGSGAMMDAHAAANRPPPAPGSAMRHDRATAKGDGNGFVTILRDQQHDQ